jgi:hypothetical protein
MSANTVFVSSVILEGCMSAEPVKFLLGDTVLSETQNAHDIQHKVAMKFF